MIFSKTNIGRSILESISDGASEKKASKRVDIPEIRKVVGGLVKVANLPYKEDVYRSVQELMKTAADYLSETATELERSLARQAGFEKALELRTLLDDMMSYGLLDPDDVEGKVAELSRKSDKEIEIVKTAVEMIKTGKTGSSLFELSKSAEAKSGKRGMFDDVL
jgi:hypothetical protein